MEGGRWETAAGHGRSWPLFSILHFLKSPEQSTDTVTWLSGFVSLGNSFSQFAEPLLVTAGFTTLFLLGWILADARVRTHSLWLPIGLHAGWIFASFCRAHQYQC